MKINKCKKKACTLLFHNISTYTAGQCSKFHAANTPLHSEEIEIKNDKGIFTQQCS